MRILAIDPGNTESGYAVIEATTYQPLLIGKASNDNLRTSIIHGTFLVGVRWVSIEMIKSYGMPVGAEVFEPCVWIGRYLELLKPLGAKVDLVYRGDVKLHHCHTSRAKDSNITQALIDRFASGVRNRGKGTIDAPGWFYGFKADIWAAYALAVLTADTLNAADVTASAARDAREVVA